MKLFLYFALLSMFVLCTTSCNGQIKKEVVQEMSQPENEKGDFDPYFRPVKTITSSYGPVNITRNIIQDRKGHIWLATFEGIIRYERGMEPSGSASFTNITNKEGLRPFRAFSVLEDRSGSIWFGTIGAGVYKYNEKPATVGHSSFTNITTKEGLVHNDVGCIYEDSRGNIWLGTRVGLSRYTPAGGEGIFTNFTDKDGLTNNDVNSIIEDKFGNLWIGTRGEACIYDPSVLAGSEKKSFSKITNDEGRPFTNVRTIIKDKNGKIWLGGNDGLWCYDGKSFINYATNFVGYIYEDRKGNIWTSSEDPVNRQNWILSRYDEKSLRNQKAIATPIKTEEGMFFGIHEDTDGCIWYGKLSGVCRYDPSAEAEDGGAFNCFRETEEKE